MVTIDDAIFIAEDETKLKVADCELNGDFYFCKIVPKNWDGDDGNIPIDSLVHTVNKNTGEFKSYSISEIASVMQRGGETSE